MAFKKINPRKYTTQTETFFFFKYLFSLKIILKTIIKEIR